MSTAAENTTPEPQTQAEQTGINPIMIMYVKGYVGVYALLMVTYIVYCFTASVQFSNKDFIERAFPGVDYEKTISTGELNTKFDDKKGHVRVWKLLQFDSANGRRYRIPAGARLTKPEAIALAGAIIKDHINLMKQIESTPKMTEDLKKKMIADHVEHAPVKPFSIHKEGFFSNLPWQNIMTLYNIFGLALIMVVFLKKPVLNMLDESRAETAEAVAKARKAQEEAENIKYHYEQLVAEVEEEKKRLTELGKVEFKEEQDNIIKRAKEDAESILQQFKDSVDAEINSSTERLRTEIVKEATLIAREQISAQADEKDHENAIDSFISDLRKAKL